MNALEIQNLHKTYANGVTALRGVNLSVQQGDFFALLGPNGAGKSTTIGILCSLVNKTAGSIRVFGDDLDHHPARVKSRIGLVPQEFNFNIFQPVGEILIHQAGYYGISRRVAVERTEHCLKELDLWDKRFEMAKDLSGGMKRRLMIARALVHRPRLLILDEPTAGVDIEIRHAMWHFMQQINAQGTTIILTTHYLEEAESLCNNIAIIDAGVTIEQTSMRDLLRRLHTETFVLYLDHPIDHLPDCGDYTVRLIDAGTLEADIQQNQSMNELFARLSACNIQVLSMKNKSNRLEQLFISMLHNNKDQAA